MGRIKIQYSFTLADNSIETFNLEIDDKTIEAVGNHPEVPPFWTTLDYYQCPNCPLTSNQHPHCPLALNLVKIVHQFGSLLSYDEVQVEVITEIRTMKKNTTVQRALRSFMGLVIAVSGCPHTAFFKPMARFHLPFADEQETIYRATSMYLLAQYFKKKENAVPDFDFNGLNQIYHNLHLINTSVAQRLRNASKTDSTVNALVLLDVFTKTLPSAIEESLEELRHLYSAFLTK